MMNTRIFILSIFSACFVTISLFASSPACAEEVIAGSVYDESKDAEVVQKARRRAYLGGRDEGDLTVQSQLTAPTRKRAPQVEAVDHSADD